MKREEEANFTLEYEHVKNFLGEYLETYNQTFNLATDDQSITHL